MYHPTKHQTLRDLGMTEQQIERHERQRLELVKMNRRQQAERAARAVREFAAGRPVDLLLGRCLRVTK